MAGSQWDCSGKVVGIFLYFEQWAESRKKVAKHEENTRDEVNRRSGESGGKCGAFVGNSQPL